jgi:xanthine dehydrogenase accessory factor
MDGVVEYPMTCHSGGTLEIYVEPFLPKPPLILVGHGPVLAALETLARSTGYSVTMIADDQVGALATLPLIARSLVVVATHGAVDEEALARALGRRPAT